LINNIISSETVNSQKEVPSVVHQKEDWDNWE